MRFEDLCLNLVYQYKKWDVIEHFGRKGNDDGIDIRTEILSKNKVNVWYIQCKRYLKFSNSDSKKVIDEALSSNEIPNTLLLIVSCDLSKSQIIYFKNYCKDKGVEKGEIWTSSIIEAKLYSDFKELLFTYFGVNLTKKSTDNISKVKQSLIMKKKVDKELIDHKYIKEVTPKSLLFYEPWRKFITDRVFIRSINDTTYPYCLDRLPGEDLGWFKTNFYNTYHNGIELWLYSSKYILVDENGYWEDVEYEDERKNNPKYKVFNAKTIGRVPYSNIVAIDKDGDEYDTYPHIFCKFNFDGTPYEEIYYRSFGDIDKQIPDWEFQKDKKTKFPKK